MKHPPSKTIGRKFWLAKVCNQEHLSKGEYGFSPANFNPTKMSLAEAREAGKAKTLWPPHGRLFGAQIWRMAHEANIGDVIFLESENRHVHAWGTITSGYQFKPLNKSSNDELHSLGVKWHKIANGQNAFRIGKGDNLLFREITNRDNLLPILKKFIDTPLKSVPQQPDKDTPQDIEYLEGGKVLRSHLATERSSKAAGLAKELARKKSKSGKLTCEACKCTPEDDYKNKQTAIDIIEAHHRIPLAKGERNTKPEDFCMLCPSCHRAVHKLINADTNPQLALNIIFECNK